MMADDMWGPPSACGKRPRSPVDKLADLAASADDDEQDWRSSKRYLTEVIASGFSKLSFKLGMPHQQQQHLAGLETGQQQLQHQGSISPKPYLPGQLGLPAAQHLQLPDGDCPMDMQESLSPPTWPPQSLPLHKPPFLASSPGSASGTGGLLGAWGPHGDGALGQQQQQHSTGPLPAAAVCAGHRTPSPEPCSCPMLASSPRGQTAPAADASLPGSGSAAAAGEGSGAGNVAGQGGVAGDEAGSSNRPGLPPLQTAKVIRAAEKQPASPSDLPAASLRKVALLRSLLARAEQQFQQQQGASGQQPQQQGVGPQSAAQQPSRMAQQGFADTPPPSCTPEQQQDTAPAAPLQHQQQQQEGVGPDNTGSSTLPWMQPWGALSCSSTGPPTLQGSFQQGRGQQPLLPVLPPRPVTPWDMSSDDMDCSSASSVVESDSSSQQGPGGSGLMQQASFDGDQDQAASTLLCQEVLFPGEDECAGGQDRPVGVGAMQGRQDQQERSYCSSRSRHNMQLPFYQAAVEQPLFGPAGPVPAAPAPLDASSLLEQQQQLLPHPTLPVLQSAGSSSAAGGPPPLPPQQQRQSRRSSVHGPSAKQGGSSPELSRHRLDELRAKALASTRQLTCLTQEDLHSLQLGLASPRRGSVDSSHAPSGLQHEGARGLSPPPALRRHSSHI